jgi:hypothetical protein
MFVVQAFYFAYPSDFAVLKDPVLGQAPPKETLASSEAQPPAGHKDKNRATKNISQNIDLKNSVEAKAFTSYSLFLIFK